VLRLANNPPEVKTFLKHGVKNDPNIQNIERATLLHELMAKLKVPSSSWHRSAYMTATMPMTVFLDPPPERSTAVGILDVDKVLFDLTIPTRLHS